MRWSIERRLTVALGGLALTDRRRCQVNWLSICLPGGVAARFGILMRIRLAIWRVWCAVVRHVAASAMRRIAGPIARGIWLAISIVIWRIPITAAEKTKRQKQRNAGHRSPSRRSKTLPHMDHLCPPIAEVMGDLSILLPECTASIFVMQNGA